jgi:hypothetical protein
LTNQLLQGLWTNKFELIQLPLLLQGSGRREGKYIHPTTQYHKGLSLNLLPLHYFREVKCSWTTIHRLLI